MQTLPLLKFEAISAIRNFFAARTNEEMFDCWQVVCESIEEAGTSKAWFYHWCYENITVDGLRFAPYGFEICPKTEERFVSFGKDSRFCKFESAPIESAVIEIPSPVSLYQKLGI